GRATTVQNRAPVRVGRVAAKGAVGDDERAVGAENAAAHIDLGAVSVKRAVDDGERAGVVHDAPTVTGRITTEGAVGDGERPFVVKYAAARDQQCVADAVGNGHTRNTDCAGADSEDAIG